MNLADPNIFKKPVLGKPRDDDQFRLIYHGALPRRYGLDLAIRAIDRVRTEIPNIHLTIIGRGEHLDELLRLVKELDLGETVRFEKFMAVEDLPAYIVTADLALVPYHNDVFTGELLPTKLLEYMALGMPAIVSRTMGILAYFDETMVQFFTPGDLDDLVLCIRELYHDRDRLASLAENVERFNQRYNWKIQSTHYVRLVDQLGHTNKH